MVVRQSRATIHKKLQKNILIFAGILLSKIPAFLLLCYNFSSMIEKLNALIFDFAYHENKGVIVYVRVFSGEVKKNMDLLFKVANEKFKSNEVGVFTPFEKEVEKLSAGEIGYIVTGIKKPGIASVGDVITEFRNPVGDEAVSEYEKPNPVV
jgi:GTP-binding protein LepA